ncbi:MAG: flagellar FlbD family protein [Armatimonadetes bacterium]|nr:flagellar FlbD family protein [Armatimonadota bacterium]
MIKVTRLNQTELVINADLIEYLESTPDVVISLTTGNKIVVRESVDAIVEKIITYKKRLYEGVLSALSQGRFLSPPKNAPESSGGARP